MGTSGIDPPEHAVQTNTTTASSVVLVGILHGEEKTPLRSYISTFWVNVAYGYDRPRQLQYIMLG